MKASKLLQAFAGTYILQNQTETINGLPYPNPDPSFCWGTPNGLITYTEAGYMAASMATSDPNCLPQNASLPLTAEQSALIGTHTLFYAGRVSINESFPSDEHSGQILHGPMTVSSYPFWIGTIQTRDYTAHYHKGKLVSLTFVMLRANGLRIELLWKKLA